MYAMTSCFQASESAVISNFVFKVMTSLGLLAFLFDCAGMGTDFIVKITKYEIIVSVLVACEATRVLLVD
jgi:hypothetical protein